MRLARVLAAVLLPLGSGCNVAYYAGHNLVNEPILRAGQGKLRVRLRGDARDAWREECRLTAPGTHPAAYRDGFLDGYVDQLDDGGPPLPPVVAPPRYRRHAGHFAPDGQTDQQHYLAGFQRGAAVAQASGCRELLLARAARTAPPPEPKLSLTCVPADRARPTGTPDIAPPPTRPEAQPPGRPEAPPAYGPRAWLPPRRLPVGPS